MSKTILSDVNGWTPLIDELVQKYGIVTAAVFGRVWRYCQMENGVCQAAMETIADELDLSRMTIYRHIETLVGDGYLIDKTPDVRNRPHTYADAGKVSMKSSISAVSQSDTGVTESYTRCNGKLQPAVTESDKKKVNLRNNSREKKESKGRAKSPAPRDSRLDHPAIKLVKAVTGQYPAKAIFDMVIQRLGNSPDGEKFASVHRAWVAKGYKPNNLAGQLEWYDNGIPVYQKNTASYSAPQNKKKYTDADGNAVYMEG